MGDDGRQPELLVSEGELQVRVPTLGLVAAGEKLVLPRSLPLLHRGAALAHPAPEFAATEDYGRKRAALLVRPKVRQLLLQGPRSCPLPACRPPQSPGLHGVGAVRQPPLGVPELRPRAAQFLLCVGDFDAQERRPGVQNPLGAEPGIVRITGVEAENLLAPLLDPVAGRALQQTVERPPLTGAEKPHLRSQRILVPPAPHGRPKGGIDVREELAQTVKTTCSLFRLSSIFDQPPNTPPDCAPSPRTIQPCRKGGHKSQQVPRQLHVPVIRLNPERDVHFHPTMP